MADNTTINAGAGGDTIRDLARQSGTTKTQVVQLDLGGVSANAEVLITAGSQQSAQAVPVVDAVDQHEVFRQILMVLQSIDFTLRQINSGQSGSVDTLDQFMADQFNNFSAAN